MTDEIRIKHIRMDADLLRKRIEGGRLYGQDIDMNDPDMLLMAAYWIGRKEEVKSIPDWLVVGYKKPEEPWSNF